MFSILFGGQQVRVLYDDVTAKQAETLNAENPLTSEPHRIYKGPEIPCLRIIKKCSSIKTAISQGNTKV